MLQLYVCDHLRPLGFLSADDLLVVGHDLEEISFFVDHSVLFISIHKHEAKRGVKRIRHVHVSSYSYTLDQVRALLTEDTRSGENTRNVRVRYQF